ncbi:MAG: DUF3365 domain-containing protein, partial [Deltaproteobacteria bacterium]|nr:DUF3365 domain-containing protein [Deltaproteobacteria bacterium]
PATQGPQRSSAEEVAINRARAALFPLKKMLKKELSAAMKKGGPLAALNVCGERAMAITQEVSAKDPGVELGRTSDKLRNPKNKAAAWLEPMLAHYQGSSKRLGSYRLTTLPSGKIGYAEPIYTKGVCLKCHGKTLQTPLTEALDKRYPDDKARGYEAGQFRGLFWVKLKPVSGRRK